MITPQNGYYGTQFRATCVTTQVVLIYPTLFSVVVDSMVWHWLYMIFENNQVIHNGLGHTVGRILRVLYVYDGLLGSLYL